MVAARSFDNESTISGSDNSAEKGWVVTSYGPLGSAERVKLGTAPDTTRGAAVSHSDIVNGTIPSKSGTVPPGVSVWNL